MSEPTQKQFRWDGKSRRSFLQIVWVIAGVVAIAVNAKMMSHPKSPVRDKFDTAVFDNAFAIADSFYTNAPASGNALVRFQGFNALHDGLISVTYLRSAYLLAPRRVYVCEPTNIVNHGRDILRAPLNVSEQWMDDHNITFVLDLSPSNNIGLKSRVRSLPNK